MKYYFGSVSNSSLPFLGPVHITLIVVTILSIYLIYKYKKKLERLKWIPYFIGITIILSIVVYVLGAIFTNSFDINYHLPVQYCYINAIFYSYMLIFKKDKLFNFLFFANFLGALSNLIFLNNDISFDRYQLVVLIITHHFLIIGTFYTLFVQKYQVSLKGLKPYLIYTLIVYILVFILNLILGTNYIFTTSFDPYMYEILPFLSYLSPLFWLVLFAIPSIASACFIVLWHKKTLNDKS